MEGGASVSLKCSTMSPGTVLLGGAREKEGRLLPGPREITAGLGGGGAESARRSYLSKMQKPKSPVPGLALFFLLLLICSRVKARRS